MKARQCIECGQLAKWELELPDDESVYVCEAHLMPVRDQLQAFIDGADGPELVLDRLLKSISEKDIPKEPGEA